LTINDSNGCIDTYCDSIGQNGVVFKQTGFSINTIAPPLITGIDDSESLNSDVNIYPNPTSNQLTIIANQLTINQIDILDITGKTIQFFTENFVNINVSNLPPSIYFIRIVSDQKIITKKFIKQ